MIDKLQVLVVELDDKLESGEIDERAYNLTLDFMNRAFDIVLDGMPEEVFQLMQGG